MNKRVFTILILIAFLSFSLHAFAQTRTDWEIYDGAEIVDFSPTAASGQNFEGAVIPAMDDPGWNVYGGPENINFQVIPSALCAEGYEDECLEHGKFTYFKTTVTVPAVAIDQFSVSADVIVDGMRVTIFNYSHPGGEHVVSTLGPGAGTTGDIKDMIVQGDNTIVITQVDDCCCSNSILNNVKISLNEVIVNTCAPPVVIVENIVKSLDYYGEIHVSAAEVDNGSYSECGIASMEVTPNIFGCADIGDNIVTLTVTDVKGVSESADAVVTVVDDTPPNLVCPQNKTVPNDAGQCGAVVTWTEPTPWDACGLESLTSDRHSGEFFDVGTTTVTYTAVDKSGLTSTCDFTITVTDEEDPKVETCPIDIQKPNDAGLCGAYVSWTPPIFSDNCGVVSFTKTHSPGDFFPAECADSAVGTLVEYEAFDAAGNSIKCSFTVTVIDEEMPRDSNCPADILVYNDPGLCGAKVFWEEPIFTDNCELVEVTSTHDPNDFFPASCESDPVPTTVTYTAIDKCGNVNDTCSFDIIVLDKEAPVLAITGVEGNYEWLRLEAEYGYWDANAIVFWNTDDIVVSYDVTDNCDPNSVITYTVEWEGNALEGVGILDTDAMTITIDPYLLVGDVEVTITATDYCGNSASVSTEFTVILKVQEMVVKPERLCINPGKFTVFVWFPDPFDVGSISDSLCDGAPMLRINTCGWCRDHLCDWCEKYFCDDDCEDDDDEDGVDYCKCHICDWCDHWSTKAILKFDRDDILDSLLDNRFVLRGVFEYNGEEVYFQGYDETKHECKKPGKPKPKPKPPKYEPCPIFPWSYPVPSVFNNGKKKGKDKGNKYGWGKSSTPSCFSWNWNIWSEIPLFYVK